VSSPSEDSELALLQRAADFMRQVREAQAGSSKQFSGLNRLEPKQQYAITNVANASALIGAVKQVTGADLAAHNLFERFEELCRRQKFAVKAELRPAVMKILAGELVANHEALAMPVQRLIGLTVQHGAIGPELIKEFPEFEKQRYVIRAAAMGRSSDPRAFLGRVSKVRDALAIDPEFERFRVVPYIFEYAAVHNVSDPRAFLRKIAKGKEGSWAARVAQGQEEANALQ
jgi:hypothetical protein